jgi:predicted membrane metal-binding protein
MLADGDTLPLSVEGRFARSVASVLSVSLAAQAATAPILLGVFGYVSGWALLLNILFVPLISAAFGFLLLFAVIACVLPISWSVFLLYLPNLLWSAALLLFEAVDFSTFLLEAKAVPMAATIAYFVGCTFLSDKWNLPKIYRKGAAWACFMVFAVVLLIANL